MATTSTPALSRRALLKWIGVSSASLTLAACAPVAPQAGGTGSQAAPAAASKELNVLVCCYAPPYLAVRVNVNEALPTANPTATGTR